MIRYENDCVGGCETCVPFCGMEHVLHCYCDRCGREVEELFWDGTDQICRDCIWDMHPEIDYQE